MQLLIVIIYFLFLLSFSLSAGAQLQTASQLLENVKSSLVEVRTADNKTFTDGNGHTKIATYHSQGSGVIIDSDGIIVTNTHIVANAPQIFVGLPDGTALEAKIVYSSDADFSFLKIDAPYPLRAIAWADSSQAQVGTPVIVLSNEDSDRGQHILGGSITDLLNGASSGTVELFELNLNLYHGDSGGPLLDNQGNLLGLIMGKKNDEDNKSYAIASNKIQQEYLNYRQNPQN